MAGEYSPSAVTLSGKSMPQAPGPSIGSICSTPNLTAPDCMQATSASCRQGARVESIKKLRPQPASASSTTPPPIEKASARLMNAKMRAVPLTRLQRCGVANSLRIRIPFRARGDAGPQSAAGAGPRAYANLATLILVPAVCRGFHVDCREIGGKLRPADALCTAYPPGERPFVSGDQLFGPAIPVAHGFGCKFRLRKVQLLRGVCVVC